MQRSPSNEYSEVIAQVLTQALNEQRSKMQTHISKMQVMRETLPITKQMKLSLEDMREYDSNRNKIELLKEKIKKNDANLVIDFSKRDKNGKRVENTLEQTLFTIYLTRAIDSYYKRHPDKKYTLKNYLMFANTVRALFSGSVVPFQTILSSTFDSQWFNVAEEVLASHTNKTSQDPLIHFLKKFDDSATHLVYLMTYDISNLEDKGTKYRIYILDKAGMANSGNVRISKLISKLNTYYPCQIDVSGNNQTSMCIDTHKNVALFIKIFVTQYLAFIKFTLEKKGNYLKHIKSMLNNISKQKNGSRVYSMPYGITGVVNPNLLKQETNKLKHEAAAAAGGGNSAYDFLSNSEWMVPSNSKELNSLYLLRETPSTTPNNVISSGSATNITDLDVLLGLNSSLDRQAYKNHGDTKKVSSLLATDNLIAKDLIELRYKLQDELEQLDRNFYSTFNLQELQDAVIRKKSTNQFRYQTQNIIKKSEETHETARRQAEKIFNETPDSEKTNVTINNKLSIIASIASIRGWPYMDLTQHAIGSLNDIAILCANIVTTNTNDFTPEKLSFMKDILRPYRAKVYKSSNTPNNAANQRNLTQVLTILARGSDQTEFKLEKDKMVSSTAGSEDPIVQLLESNKDRDTAMNETKTLLTDENGAKLKFSQNQEYLIMVVYNVFETVIKWLEKMAEATLNNTAQEGMKKSINNFKLIAKSGIKNYYGITSPAKYAIDIGDNTDKAKLDPMSEITRIIGGPKNNIKRLDRLQPETYAIAFKTSGNATHSIDKKETVKRFAAILQAADKDIFIGGPILQEVIMKESVALIAKYVTSEIKAKKANIKRIDIIINKMKRRVHKQDLKRMARLLELTYKDIATERDSRLKKLQIESSLQTITTTYRGYKDNELIAMKAMLSFSKLYDEQYKALASNRKTKNNYIKEREKIVVDLLYNQLKAKTYRNLATTLYKFLKDETGMNPTMNDINYNKALPESFYTLLENALDRVDEAYNQQLSATLGQASPNMSQPSVPLANEDDINDFFSNIDKKYLRNINSIINNTNRETNINVSNIDREISGVNNVFKNALKNANKATKNNKNNSKRTSTRVKTTTNRANNRANNRPSTNISLKSEIRINQTRLTKQSMQLIASEKFWLTVREKFDGKTVFVPYEDDKKLISTEHGFFDILEAAIRGKIYKQFIIPGVYVNMKTLSQIYGNNYLMVTDTNKDKANPNLWQLMPMEVITTMSKLSQDDLRLYIYLLITSSANYNKRLSKIWQDDSVTKEKVLNYCRIISGYEGCPILKSRYEISNFLQ